MATTTSTRKNSLIKNIKSNNKKSNLYKAISSSKKDGAKKISIYFGVISKK
jgi:hypothetical protein